MSAKQTDCELYSLDNIVNDMDDTVERNHVRDDDVRAASHRLHCDDLAVVLVLPLILTARLHSCHRLRFVGYL